MHSYWFDDRIKEILLHDRRHLSKKSILFLLECDVWETDETFGSYLSEIHDDTTEISYYRFFHKFKTYSLKDMNASAREEWIKQDAVNQINLQFQILWKQIEKEIISCEDEVYHPPLAFQFDDIYLVSQFEICQKLLSISKEASLLMLGRKEELLLLKAMNLSQIPFKKDILFLAEVKGLLNKSNKHLFRQIRHHYNRVKHNPIYNIDNCDVEELGFSEKNKGTVSWSIQFQNKTSLDRCELNGDNFGVRCLQKAYF